MQGISPKLPIVRDKIDGSYSMNKTALESIKQDLKMLLLTNPGERMMNPDYGVGLRQFLFSQDNPGLRVSIDAKIQEQITKYMSFVSVANIRYQEEENSNSLYFVLEYFIPSLNKNDELILALAAN